MQRIHLLEDSLINRIAAGEVVERPASVVKELVENSLDARATSVEVRVEVGGRRAIQVLDNGVGMGRDDALLCVERHATSKLIRMADLESIATLGFRGEALSSIAAVSEFTLSTATEDGAGTIVRIHGGKIRSVEESGLPKGTTIDARRLFFNVPARRKFLRSESTELSHIVRWLTRYALARPDVRFELWHGARNVIQAPRAQDRSERIGQIHGAEFLGRLLPFELNEEGLRIQGFAGRPAEALARREAQHLFVNGRAVQDRMLLHAISKAYGNTTVAGRFPSVLLFVDIDPSQVDVNVHPQKTEVRFRDTQRTHDAVREALASALSHVNVMPSFTELRYRPNPGILRPDLPGTSELSEPITHRPFPPWEGRSAQSSAQSLQGAPRVTIEVEHAAPSHSTAPGLLDTMEPEAPDHGVVPLAQYRNSFIIAQNLEGLVLIDQHAAHERVLFEKFLADADANQVEVQRLLFPVTFELAPHEQVLVEAELEEFRRLGFEVDPFGGRTVRLSTVPALAAALDPEQVFRDLIGETAAAKSTTSEIGSLRRRLVTTAACKAAVKFNDSLNTASMQALIDDLFRCDSPSTCPHGRPILFRLTDRELERTFGRH